MARSMDIGLQVNGDACSTIALIWTSACSRISAEGGPGSRFYGLINVAHQDWRWLRGVPRIRMLKQPRRREPAMIRQPPAATLTFDTGCAGDIERNRSFAD